MPKKKKVELINNVPAIIKKTPTKELSAEILNSLTSLVAGLGLDTLTQLSSSQTLIKNNSYSFISNDRSTLSYSYKTHGLIQTLIDQPVEDAYRGGVKIKSEQLDEDDIKEIQNWMVKNKVLETFKNAVKWTRLYGGGGIVINTTGKSDTKLNPEKITEDTPLEFYDVDLWELNFQNIGTGSARGKNGKLKQPYENNMDIPYSYYDMRLHKSRLLKMNGKKAPAFLRPSLRGWGMSEVERLIRSINQYLKNNDLIFELLDEAKLDVYKMKGFNNLLMTKKGTETVRKRIQLSNQAKNFQNAMLLDAEDDHQQKQIDFNGLSDILGDIRIGVASDLKMPLTKLFGVSSAGFNSGEDDIENYNSMIESDIRRKYDCQLLEIIQLITQKLFGLIPEDLRIEYKALRILSAEQEETVKDKQFARATSLYQQGIISAEEYKQEINTNNLISIDIKADDTVFEVADMEKEEDKDDTKKKEKKNSLFKRILRIEK